jgi:hypothetical protein
LPAVIFLNLRELFEARYGKLGDEQYNHVFRLALDDQKQYVDLTQEEINALVDPAAYPPNSRGMERLDEIRERLLEAMGIIADIVKRRKLH